MRHKIYARHENVNKEDRFSIPFIKGFIRFSLDMEYVTSPCEISVLITNDDVIREINKEFRGIDKATDVLTFPMIEFSPPGWDPSAHYETDVESGLIPLGEIVFSVQRIREQAAEFKHSAEQEVAYLTVHSVLHLLGYDHVDEATEKRRMREREKHIISMDTEL